MSIRLPTTVLLLEDEAIIAIDAEEMLAASGVTHVFTHQARVAGERLICEMT